MDWLITKSNSCDTNVINQSEVTKDLYELYKSYNETNQLISKIVACIFGIVIFICNLSVVISSGLILKKDQQRKSTYLLLGNVSLADAMIGILIIFGVIVEKIEGTTPLCLLQTGTLVCSFMVSIFTVGFIAVDRYFYILHGLYYQRWFNTTKIRVGILCIWLICIPLGFLPATGWINTELKHCRCYYVSLFPETLILLNTVLSAIPILLVAVLYTIILVKALNNVKNINATVKNLNVNNNKMHKIKPYRSCEVLNETIKLSNQSVSTNSNCNIKKNETFNENLSHNCKHNNVSEKLKQKSKSNNDIFCNSNDIRESVDSFDTSVTDQNADSNKINKRNVDDGTKANAKMANKWRAITVVMLTSGSFVITLTPFFVTVNLFLSCPGKFTNPKCIHLIMALNGPFRTLAFLNSILNPLIYAWWHKGFRKSIRSYYRRYLQRFCQIDELY